MQINKCDRCGRIAEEVIDFRFINTNESEEVETFFGVQKAYLAKTYELCFDCAMSVARWLAHSENDLKDKELKGK